MKPSWYRRRRIYDKTQNASSDTMSTSDAGDSDTDTVSTGTEDGRYRPRFLPGHLFRKLRERPDASIEDVLDPDLPEPTPSAQRLPQEVYRRTPLLSGALAPFSIMLEVPGLTTKWYVRKGDDGSNVEYRDNPTVLTVGLAFSIAAAVFANAMLIMRFVKIVRPRKATLLAVLGFLLHDAINIAALTAFGVIHSVDDGFTFSQAYWMTVASTSASVACTVTLVMDYFATKDFKSAGSGLTQKQTQLVIVIIVLMIYLSIGSLSYSLLLHIPFEAALYFTCTTTLAVGFGDIVPTTTASRIVLFIYAPIGITLFAVTIYIASGTLLEHFESNYRKRRNEFHERLKARRRSMKENRRERRRLRNMERKKGVKPSHSHLFGLIRHEGPSRAATALEGKSWGGQEGETANTSKNQKESGLRQKLASRAFMRFPAHREKLSEAPDPATASECMLSGSAGSEAQFLPNESGAEGGVDARISNDLMEMEAALARQRQELEWNWSSFRNELAKREHAEFWIKLSTSLVLFLAFWLLGAMVFHFTEDWSYFTAFYFCFVLFTTIGFGDYTPTSDAGRSFFIIWSLLGVAVLTVLISVFSDAWSSVITSKLDETREAIRKRGRELREKVRERRRRKRRSKQLRQTQTVDDPDDLGGATEDADQSEGPDDDGVAGGQRSEVADQSGPDGTSGLGLVTSRVSSDTAPQGGGILAKKDSMLPPIEGSNDVRPPNRSLTAYFSDAVSQSHAYTQSPNGNDSATGSGPAAAAATASASELPLALAKAAISLQDAAANYVDTRRGAFIAALSPVAGLSQALPELLGSGGVGQEPSMPQSAGGNPASPTSATAAASLLLELDQSPALLAAIAQSPDADAARQAARELSAFLGLQAQTHGLVQRAALLRAIFLDREKEVGQLKARVSELEAAAAGAGEVARTEDGGPADRGDSAKAGVDDVSEPSRRRSGFADGLETDSPNGLAESVPLPESLE